MRESAVANDFNLSGLELPVLKLAGLQLCVRLRVTVVFVYIRVSCSNALVVVPMCSRKLVLHYGVNAPLCPESTANTITRIGSKP